MDFLISDHPSLTPDPTKFPHWHPDFQIKAKGLPLIGMSPSLLIEVKSPLGFSTLSYAAFADMEKAGIASGLQLTAPNFSSPLRTVDGLWLVSIGALYVASSDSLSLRWNKPLNSERGLIFPAYFALSLSHSLIDFYIPDLLGSKGLLTGDSISLGLDDEMLPTIRKEWFDARS